MTKIILFVASRRDLIERQILTTRINLLTNKPFPLEREIITSIKDIIERTKSKISLILELKLLFPKCSSEPSEPKENEKARNFKEAGNIMWHSW